MNFSDYQTLILNGQTLKGEVIVRFCKNQESQNLKELGIFMAEWLSPKPTLEVQTSGSTGQPKKITVQKEQMLASAKMTAQYFHFRPGQTALLCLPVHYIAGKMMVVRALYSHLNLITVEPQKDPLSRIDKDIILDFAPLTPMQVDNLNGTKKVKNLLLGGAPITQAFIGKIQSLKAHYYQSYGMTETLSHIAIRPLNGPNSQPYYEAVAGVHFEQDERGCLVASVPFLAKKVITNDIIELIDATHFLWKGRADNVINSGGIKLFPEEIEQKLVPLIANNFFVIGEKDDKLGQKLCLVIESEQWDDKLLKNLTIKMKDILSRYEVPKTIYFTESFARTSSGKIQRTKTFTTLIKKNND